MTGSSRTLLVLGVLSMTAVPLVAQEPTVTLAEAVRRAEAVQPRVVQALGATRSADARLRAAKGAWLPNLTLNGSGNNTYSDGPSRIDPASGLAISGATTTTSWQSSLSTSLELFDGFRRSNESRAARANSDAADASLLDARFQQGLTTTNQFFDALAARQLVTVRQAGVRRAEEQLAVSQARLATGAATRSDTLRSAVTLGTARLNLLNAETQLATAEANLGRLVGLDGRVRAADDSAFYRTVAMPDTSSLRAEALSSSPQVVSAEASRRAAEAGLGASRASWWPTVNLNASGSISANQRNDYTVFPSRSVSVSVNWPIFNRFNREQQIANQLVSLDNAEASAAEARRQVQANLTTRLAELEAADLRIRITRTSVAAATEDLRVQQERYRLGAATIVDVLTSQEALAQAEVDEVNARFDYLRAKVQLEALLGRSL